MISAIILAAGESRRMGTLKPLITINGKTFLKHIVDQLVDAHIEHIQIVLGYKADHIQKSVQLDNVEFVKNEHYSYGQFSSLQTAIRHLDKRCEAVIVCLGDQPQIKSKWIKKLIGHYKKSDAYIYIPCFKEKRGHPILYTRDLFEEIMSMPPTQTARDLTKKHNKKIKYIDIDDENILFDADTPDDLIKMKETFD